MLLIGAVGGRVVCVIYQLSAAVTSNELLSELHLKLLQGHWGSSWHTELCQNKRIGH